MIGNPFPLKQNEGKSFIGSYILGMGFVLETEQVRALIAKDIKNQQVLFPYLNGEDLNNHPEQKPSRWVINFFDWDEDKARTYIDCFEIVEKFVKPERQRWKIDDKGAEIFGTYALSVYSVDVDQVIPWQVDHLYCWQERCIRTVKAVIKNNYFMAV